MAEVFAGQVREAQISVEALSVFYGDVCVLSGVDLKVMRGEFVSVVGSSGSGKTTLLNSLAGFISYQGSIRVPGKIGVVFQDYSAFPWMTVSENIAFGLHDGGRRAGADEIVRQHLKLIKLEDSAGKYPAELSGGQVQRVGIARALAPNPDVILMDEPYGALDRDTRERMQKWLLDVWAQDNKTIFFITHDIEEAIFLSDRVLVLGGNRIADEYPVPFDRPRTEDIKFTHDFTALKRTIFDKIRFYA